MNTHVHPAPRAPTYEPSRQPAVRGLETKAAGDDDDADDVDGVSALTKAVEKLADASTKGQAALEKRIQDMQDEQHKRANRARLAGYGGEEMKGFVVGADIEGLDAERKALADFARSGDDSGFKSTSMSVGSDPAGGYFVQPVRSSTMTQRLQDLSPMRRLARVETVTAGDVWEEPLDLNESGAIWVTEKQKRPATETPDFGMLSVPINEIYALQTVTQRLLDDAAFDLGTWLDGKINDKFGRSEGLAFVTGDGIKKPKGLVTYATAPEPDLTRPWGEFQHVISGAASALGSAAADNLRSLVWALRAPYRPGASWLMNSNTAGLLDKLKDDEGNYLWRTGMTAGAASSLLGYPVEIDEGMPDVGADALPIAFGNFKLAYLIVEKAGVKSLRDPYTDKPNVLFYAYRRVGGGAANFEAVKFMKIAAS